MEQLTFNELKQKANKELNKEMKDKFTKKGLSFAPINFPLKDILLWGLLNGYKKKRIQVNKERKIYYIKP